VNFLSLSIQLITLQTAGEFSFFIYLDHPRHLAYLIFGIVIFDKHGFEHAARDHSP